jgi:WD40 repeat protein
VRQLADSATSPARGLCFSPDGSRLYSAGLDKTVRVWKVEYGSKIGDFLTPALIDSVTLVKNGGLLVTGHEDGQVRTWDLAAWVPTTAAKLTPLIEIKAHTKPINALAALPSAPGQVITASEDGLLRHWDLTAK